MLAGLSSWAMLSAGVSAPYLPELFVSVVLVLHGLECHRPVGKQIKKRVMVVLFLLPALGV
ncbi:hypothetical protein DPMN_151982 [Dreissena polymorpha]|uniref:Uncharacterized protein n=1 Tax=Dreissena polymorpha TaxID=45954 RepID=A0A9D4FGD9_DREPO|nr:hypothetical protein DPMN_151982 [Dreissena polymorpha]